MLAFAMLFEPLFAHAANKPQETAVIDDRGSYSWQQLAAMSAGLGMYLSFQTRQPSVGLLLPSSAGFLVSFYGTLLAGKSAVAMNFLLGDREIAHVIADSGIDTVVTIPQLAPRLKDSAGLKIIDLTQLPQSPPAAITRKIPSVNANDLALLIYTSGTSGLPKGVELTYGNLYETVRAAIEAAALRGEHKFLGIVPPFHSLGITATVVAPVTLGAPVVYQARFSAVAVMNAIREHKLSLIFAVPSMYGALLHLKNASADDWTHTYAVISGGEPLPEAIREKFKQRFNVNLLEGYGLTETTGPIAVNVPQAQRAGSVGRLLPGASAKFIDDNGNAVPEGQSGEILLRGPMIMRGYHNLPDETAAALTGDGHFRTGDLGRMDADGFIYITGRKKEMISVAGEKAAPREIEDTLLRHPAIADAAVVGKRDPSRGEVVVAFVIAKEGQDLKPDQVRDFCRDAGLAQWKCPREVHVVPELPRSPTGKVLKRVLVEKLQSM
jgi:long-chain acyl-CoA synthetase